MAGDPTLWPYHPKMWHCANRLMRSRGTLTSCLPVTPALGSLRNTLTTATSLIAYGFATTPLVTNSEVTCNSAAEDGATDQGMACIWLTVRHGPVLASLRSLGPGSSGAGFVSRYPCKTSTAPSSAMQGDSMNRHWCEECMIIRKLQEMDSANAT